MNDKTWPTAIISGGASGIGLRTAEMLRERGTAIAILDRSIGEQARTRLQSADGPHTSFHEVDVTDGDALERAVADAVAAIGSPALALNCAGVQDSAVFSELTEQRYRRVIEVNLIGSRNFAAAVLPHMRSGSRLALVSSMAGVAPLYGYSAYSSSKFGVVGLAGCLRLEYKPAGIDVSVICPPEVDTPMVEDERRTGNPITFELKKLAPTLTVEEACEEIVKQLAAGRWMIVPGRQARLTRRLAQFMPALMSATSDLIIRRALAQRAGR